MVYTYYIWINRNILKSELEIFNAALILLLWVSVLFLAKKMLNFCKKYADINKIKGILVLKGIFSETRYYICVCNYVPNFKFLA